MRHKRGETAMLVKILTWWNGSGIPKTSQWRFSYIVSVNRHVWTFRVGTYLGKILAYKASDCALPLFTCSWKWASLPASEPKMFSNTKVSTGAVFLGDSPRSFCPVNFFTL